MYKCSFLIMLKLNTNLEADMHMIHNTKSTIIQNTAQVLFWEYQNNIIGLSYQKKECLHINKYSFLEVISRYLSFFYFSPKKGYNDK